MQTSDKLELRLTLINASVFAAVLVTFVLIVFFFVAERQNQDTYSDIRHLADAVVASIDFDEDPSRSPDKAEPDLIASAMPDSASSLLNSLRLEWFNYKKQLAAQKGAFEINVPFAENEATQIQNNPHGIVYSRPVFDQGRLLGYVRVAQPLDKQDRFISNLVAGLAFGTAGALILTSFGVFVLVKQSLLPMRKNVQRLRQFTSDASHELRNPVTAIRSNSAVALKYADGMRTTDKEKFEMIESAARQMQQLVENLLLLSRAENVKNKSVIVNLLTASNEVVEGILQLSKDKKITIKVAVSPELNVLICPDDLRCILSNLIENALRYTPAGGTVTINASQDRDKVWLTVEDTGVGIASEDIEKVFDRFWRADKARTFHDSGQGLGLSIAKALVDQHGGSISVTSEVGKGSIFKVSLDPVLPNSAV